MSINNNLSNPTQMSTRSAEKQKGGVKVSIRTKITFWAGLFLTLISLALVGYSVVTLRQTSIDNSQKEASAIAEARAGLVKNQLDAPLLAARTLAYSLSANKDTGIKISLSRDEVNGMLRKVLIENPSFLGTYTLWEPNTFDGVDADYVGAVAHDSTGRFIPYWVRGDDGIIHTEALAQYEIPGVGDWYILPRSSKQEVTIAPIFRRIQGQDVVIASFIIPIVLDDTFYGIAGVDAPIGFVQQLVDDIDLYEGSTNAVLFTDTGTLIAVRQKPELVNQPASLIYEDFDKIQPQLGSSFTRLSPDGKYLQIFSPIDVGGGGADHWVMGLIIPFEKITAPATTAALREAAIGAGLIVLALIFLWLLAGQIVRPLQVLTNAATAVSQGDWTVKANVHSKDEAEVLANAFNTMTSQLQTAFSTLEQRVAARTKDLATVSTISTQIAAVRDPFQMLATMVHLTQRGFDLYHAHVFTYHKDSNELQITACGYKEGDEHEGTHGTTSISISQEQSLVARAARSRKPVIVNDVRSDPGWLPNPLLPETRAEMAVPMIVGDELLGVLDVQADYVDAFTEEDANIQMTLASQISTSYQSALAYEQSKAQADLESLVNTIGQKIQRTVTVEDTLQTAIREIGLALGASRVSANIQSSRENVTAGEGKGV